MSTAQAIVEDEVRELVRRRGIDPVAEGGAVRQLVDEVVGDYRDRAVTAALPPLGDPSHVTRRVVDAVADSVRCSRFSMIRRSRRSGLMSPAGCSSPGADARS